MTGPHVFGVPEHLRIVVVTALLAKGLSVSAVPVSAGQAPRYVVGGKPHGPSAAGEPSERELQVLALLATGASNARIGDELGLSEHTVRTHLQRLYRKLGVQDRAHAVDEGWRRGLLGGVS